MKFLKLFFIPLAFIAIMSAACSDDKGDNPPPAGPDQTTSVALSVTAQGGQLLAIDGTELPTSVPSGKHIQLKAVPNSGYVLDRINITYGDEAAPKTSGILYTNFAAGEGIIPGSFVNGKVTLTGVFVPDDGNHNEKYADRGYRLVWNDEFNGPDGTTPDFDNKWSFSERYHSTWNRFNSPRRDLYKLEDGYLVMKSMKNNDKKSDPAEFVTSALQTSGHFGFTHGIVEARLRIYPHVGNFPAFWMMPWKQTNGGWPYCGEIDIFEQIDEQAQSWHTIHGYWYGSQSFTGTYSASMNAFHVYSFEWDEESMKWFVDGVPVTTYLKSQYTSTTYPYPFDDHFYIILDMAVGDGSWAAPYDAAHTYMMKVDYVRVYQRAGQRNTRDGVVQ